MPAKNRNAALLVGCLAVLGGILYGYWNFFYKPLNQLITQDRETVQKLDGELQVAQARAAQLGAIQAEMASLQVEVAALEKQLPKGRELPSLIRLFTHRAEASGLTLASFAPQKPIPKGLYDEITYNITLSASFHSLGRFLTLMGKGDRLFASRDLAMTAAANKADPATTVNATFKLVAFKYHE